MARHEWSGIPASRDPPDVVPDLVRWKNLDINEDIYNDALLQVWWRPRPPQIEERSRELFERANDSAYEAYKDAKKKAERAYDRAFDFEKYRDNIAEANREFDEAVNKGSLLESAKYTLIGKKEAIYRQHQTAGSRASREIMLPAERAYDEAVAYAAAKHLFDPPSTEYVLYRGDEDLWVVTDDAQMAGRLLVAAASEMRQEHGEVQERLTRDREYAKKGVTLASFDPKTVFVKRHERRQS